MSREAQANALREAALAAAGMCMFALFVHSRSPRGILSACGLAAVLYAMFRSMRAEPSPAALFGFSPVTPKIPGWAALGLVLGAAMAALFRCNSGLGVYPRAFGNFAPVAGCIGIAEEILFRGYIQGRLNRACGGRRAAVAAVLAVGGAAVCHAAFKCALFALPPFSAQTDIAFLALWTFLGGVAFGALRQYSRSVVPPLAAHAVFDILVYGGLARAPGWVWS